MLPLLSPGALRSCRRHTQSRFRSRSPTERKCMCRMFGAVFGIEVTNALVKALRRKQITREELFEYAAQLGGLHTRVDPESSVRAFGPVLTLAERHQLTTYDASYLELAQRRGLPL